MASAILSGAFSSKARRQAKLIRTVFDSPKSRLSQRPAALFALLSKR
ncbi:MAG: hypothetical protein KKB35_02550 [Proteobacteria bacterium]|nr:hypothetical protein [Pseudomonadota bacterium]